MKYINKADFDFFEITLSVNSNDFLWAFFLKRYQYY